jgi:hypothetical protein
MYTMPTFKRSTRKNKKYMVKYNGKWIHFGSSAHQQYKDSTGLGLYTHLNHNDKKRRKNYLARAKGIKNKSYLNKNSANYYAVNFLW